MSREHGRNIAREALTATLDRRKTTREEYINIMPLVVEPIPEEISLVEFVAPYNVLLHTVMQPHAFQLRVQMLVEVERFATPGKHFCTFL